MFVELEKYLNIIDTQPEFNELGSKKFEVGDIVFENVEFKYPKADAPVIKNISFKIPNGKKVAFVGFSGSGKSTIIKLLLRIYDWTSGEIKVGDKSLRELDSKTWRQRVGYVEQHVDLFDASVKENILFGVLGKKNTNFKDEKLLEIVKKARIDQFFHRLGKAGLDTVIGERGVKLSGGERQRIGIGRALAKDPDILIFDEATASLDTENEKFIQEAIDESSKGRTTIIIAHRLSTIQNSDIIFVMSNGEIVDSGTHAELLNSSPEYQRLVHAQTS
jgi:ABC-type multidrug transport system fused ATPase/permease subunit